MKTKHKALWLVGGVVVVGGAIYLIRYAVRSWQTAEVKSAAKEAEWELAHPILYGIAQAVPAWMAPLLGLPSVSS